MKVVDIDGAILDATFSVLPLEGGIISLDYESSGGSHRGEPSHRNHHYRQGLNVLFQRLQSINAVIPEIRIETGTARSGFPTSPSIWTGSFAFIAALSRAHFWFCLCRRGPASTLPSGTPWAS